MFNELALGLLLFQVPFSIILLSRLIKGPSRRPPLEPQPPTPDQLGTISIVVPTLNEAQRLSPCLAGLTKQSYEVREMIVVDSRSTDGTPDLVQQAAAKDPRFRLIEDDPLPPGWVGRPWALQAGFLHSSAASEWILGIDADTYPHPALAATVARSAAAAGYDLVSLSPQFILKTPGEMWLQPSLLMTLVYRFGPTGTNPGNERVMANGQCFLCRRSVLEAVGGYTVARESFCDDVTLARHIAQRGYKVGFWDGAKLVRVRMYEGAAETWREWGRSLDLQDASSPAQLWGDLCLLLAVQGLPLPMAVILLLSLGAFGGYAPFMVQVALGLNLFLVAVRFALNWAIVPSYQLPSFPASWSFWLSPLADPIAWVRILLSTIRRPTQWRGRQYELKTKD